MAGLGQVAVGPGGNQSCVVIASKIATVPNESEANKLGIYRIEKQIVRTMPFFVDFCVEQQTATKSKQGVIVYDEDFAKKIKGLFPMFFFFFFFFFGRGFVVVVAKFVLPF